MGSRVSLFSSSSSLTPHQSEMFLSDKSPGPDRSLSLGSIIDHLHWCRAQSRCPRPRTARWGSCPSGETVHCCPGSPWCPPQVSLRPPAWLFSVYFLPQRNAPRFLLPRSLLQTKKNNNFATTCECGSEKQLRAQKQVQLVHPRAQKRLIGWI